MIEVRIKHQRIDNIEDNPDIVAGSQGFVHMHFECTDDWGPDINIVAEFYRKNKETQEEILLPKIANETRIVEVPWEVMVNEGTFIMCVIGESKAGQPHQYITVEAVEITVKPNGRISSVVPGDPSPGFYADALNKALDAIEKSRQDAVTAVRQTQTTAVKSVKSQHAAAESALTAQEKAIVANIQKTEQSTNAKLQEFDQKVLQTNEAIGKKQQEAIEAVDGAETRAVETVDNSATTATNAIKGLAEEKNTLLSSTARKGVEDIGQAQTTAEESIASKQTAAETAIGQAKTTALQEVESSSKGAADSALAAQTSAGEAANSATSASDSATEATNQASSAASSATKAEQEAYRAAQVVDGKADLVDYTNNMISIPLLAIALGQAGEQLKKVTARLKEYESIETGRITLNNSEHYPFNNSKTTLALKSRRNKNYIVLPEVESFSGGSVGEIQVTDRLTNGFKLSHTGSAKKVTVFYTVLGGV